jgi:hypothetical protein
MAGFGDQTKTYVAGGSSPSPSNSVEEYNGSIWSTAPSLTTARQSLVGAGNTSTGAVFGGSGTPGGTTSATEEFTGETVTQVARTLSSS